MTDVGLTTSIPVEILFAAGMRPVDLNNVFISQSDPAALVRRAEQNGFPSTCCAWIKGIYGVVASTGIRKVVGVVRGDCSQTQGLLEVLEMEGLDVIPFSFPYDRSRSALEAEIQRLARDFGADPGDVTDAKRILDCVRDKLQELDRLTWEENRVTGEENHRYLVASSDMRGDPEAFGREIDIFLAEARDRKPAAPADGVRLGVLGVPPIWADLYGTLERCGCRVVFNEVQRQFSMPFGTPDLVEQYLRFTYPYDVFARIEDIRRGRGPQGCGRVRALRTVVLLLGRSRTGF